MGEVGERDAEMWTALVERVRAHPNDVLDIVLESERVAEARGRDAERARVVARARAAAGRARAMGGAIGSSANAALLDFADEVERGEHEAGGEGSDG